MSERTLLLVSYHFPPMGGSGVQRALKFAKYLPGSGWRVRVLTAAHRHYPLMDDSLLRELDERVAIHRVAGWEPGGIAARLGRWLSRCRVSGTSMEGSQSAPSVEDRIFWRLERLSGRLPLVETESLWTHSAIRAARQIIREHRIDAVMTTSPPHCVHRVGMALRESPGLPWIADLRDPIVDNFGIEEERLAAERWRHSIEKDVCTSADRVVVTCPDLRDRIIDRHAIHSGKVQVITNGFDPEDAPAQPAKRDRSRFRIGHFGSFYRSQSIEPILSAFRAFLAACPEAAGQSELLIAGHIAARQRRLIAPADAAFLRESGYLSHAAATSEMAAADALFLMTPLDRRGRFCIPAKVFEYLAFGGHIIAMVHRGSGLEQVLSDAPDVSLVGSGDVPALAAAIEARYRAWRAASERPQPRRAGLDTYRRDMLAARLAAALEDVCDKMPVTAARLSTTPDGIITPNVMIPLAIGAKE